MTKSATLSKASLLSNKNYYNPTICSACHAPHIPKPNQNGLCYKCHSFNLGAEHLEIARTYFKASESAKP